MGESLQFDNATWQAELRKRDGFRYCEFPGLSEIRISGTRECATLTMTAKGLNSNMQSDASAAEPWALTLLLHCGAKTVEIGVEKTEAGKGSPHYQRFLYRLYRLTELFPEDIRVEPSLRADMNPEGNILRFLNQPGKNRRSPDPQSKTLLAMRLKENSRVSESLIEKALETSNKFRAHFCLEKVTRQWPVGLFRSAVKDANRIFSGGKSAIDLIAVCGETLSIFELKKEGNRKAGAVSELFFYANVMRDATGRSPLFKFDSKAPNRKCEVSPAHIGQCSKIRAILLAPDFHPLIPSLLEKLNERETAKHGIRAISFETAAFKLPSETRDDFDFDCRP